MLQTTDTVEIIVVANCTLSSPHFSEPEINSSTVHFRISATFLMFLTVGLTLFPHLQILPVDTFAFSSNLLIEIPRSFASLQIFS